MAKRKRTPEENARREAIRELLQMSNIKSMDDIQDLFKETIVEVAISKQFLGWVIALGENIKITAPKAVVEQMQEEAKRLYRQYL